MLRNKLILVVLVLFITSCSSSDTIKVEKAYEASVDGDNYIVNVNGESKEISIYEHVETIDGKDTLVPNEHVAVKGGRIFQLNMNEKIVEFNGKKYVIPKTYQITGIDSNEEIKYVELAPDAVFIDSSGEVKSITQIILK